MAQPAKAAPKAPAKAKVSSVKAITVQFDAKRVKSITDNILRSITDDFDSTIIKASGIDLEATRQSVLADSKFQAYLEKAAGEYLEELFDYRDDSYNNKAVTTAYAQLEKASKAFYEAQDKADAAAKRENQAKSDAARLIAALEMVKKAGYKIVS
jgi:hypothetical protein